MPNGDHPLTDFHCIRIAKGDAWQQCFCFDLDDGQTPQAAQEKLLALETELDALHS
jgi:hypothetical protein